MYRVFIADDEPSVINSLKLSIDWKGLGLEIAACASNGKEVLELIQKEKIDIAILDIRMPGMSGLELCEYLKRRYVNLQIIFISGYAEFSYAQKALSYGALGYCLKPLEYDQITKLLVKAEKQLDKEAKYVSGTDLLDALESGNLQGVTDTLAQMGFQEEQYYVAVSVGEEKISVLPEEGVIVETGRGQYGYIMRNSLSDRKMEQFLSKDGNESIGYEKEPVQPADLPETIDLCAMRAFQFFVDENCRICGETDGTRAGELLAQLAKNVEKNRWEDVCEQLAFIDEKYRHSFHVRNSMKLCNMIHTGSLFREEKNDYYIYSLKQLVSEYGTFSDMLKRLQEEIRGAGAAQSGQEPFSNTAFMKLMRYIGENYRSEISLTSAGAALHMNPNYVSQLFKKETGTTFVHYITQLRMEDAMRLLSTTVKPVTEIATDVGFNDYFYFLKTFKKRTGKTPGQYREET